MEIEELAQREIEIYDEVCSVEGLMEYQYTILEERGIFERYKEIHNEYARLCDNDVEALKRGLFIQWYAMTEPGCYTGISEINLFAERRILDRLYTHFQIGTIDPEIVWMCNYYIQIAEWIFDNHSELKNFFKDSQTSISVLPECIDKEAMSKRGQMGMYWNSLSRFENC